MTAGEVVFVAASLVLAYALFGYPLLLGWLSRSFGRPVKKGPFEPRISFIIAAYNGELYLERKLRSILALDYPREKMEILVASDGSTDRTEAIAESFAEQGVQLFRLPRGGKPAALNAMIPQAHGEILVLTDIRQELEPQSVKLLMECFADPRVGVTSGELLIRTGSSQGEASVGLYWRFETWMRDRLSLVDSMFGATGPFYAMRRELACFVPPDTLLDDMYLPLHAFFAGYRLVMEPRAKAFDIPTSLKTEFRRKVRTLAGNYQLLGQYPQLLGPGNRMWFHFVSYKIGRLVLPWMLMLILGASFFLPPVLRTLALGFQAVFYGLAAADGAIGESSPLKRLTGPISAFAVMMWAAVMGLSVFFVPPRELWKVTSASPQKEGAKS
jgi:cellulose synthase/poly-beta-1,6-N-acetylglucosamine synthase-like glycosyltransferase